MPKLKIMGKALSCSPPIRIELFVENLSSKPFYRIEVPSGSRKPYSTNNGTYKIRDDGRNTPLLPEQLLSIFLDKEGEEFRKRFSQATGTIEKSLNDTLGLIEQLEYIISSKIEDIADNADNAEWEANRAKNTIEDVERIVISIQYETNKLQKRSKSLIQHLEATDPVKEEAKNEVLDYLQKKLTEDPDLLKSVLAGNSISLSGSNIGELTKEDLSELLNIALKKVTSTDQNV